MTEPRHTPMMQQYLAIKAQHAEASSSLFNRGLGYYTQKRFRLAIDDFAEALRRNKDNTAAREYLTSATQALQNQVVETRELKEEAKRYAERRQYKREI